MAFTIRIIEYGLIAQIYRHTAIKCIEITSVFDISCHYDY